VTDIVQGFRQALQDILTPEVRELKAEVTGLRGETNANIGALKQEISALRVEMNAQIGALRQEMNANDGALKQEVNALRIEMNANDHALREEMNARTDLLNEKIDGLRAEVRKRLPCIASQPGKRGPARRQGKYPRDGRPARASPDSKASSSGRSRNRQLAVSEVAGTYTTCSESLPCGEKRNFVQRRGGRT
jgi:hypothetical protein